MVGVVYGYWGVATQGMSIESGLLAGGLCSVAGMLPDLDSDTGVPLRETTLFLSAVIPILMVERFRDMGLSHEAMALAAMLIYVLIRFVVVEFFRRYTVHRGMWHSIPAALSAALAAYLIMPCPSEAIRVYKSLAVLAGFLTHLILDEIWSLDFSGGGMRVKKSFGTALKFFGNNWWANISAWGKLLLLCYIAWGDHGILDRLRQRVRLERERYSIPESAWPTDPSSFYPLPDRPEESQPAASLQPSDSWQAQPSASKRIADPGDRPALPHEQWR
ncbi:hypothetical protein CA85_49380 [Allorhodopirellula solitaria]|uniref:Inner membrane protein n=2 Tax=Allorhodopirellula solitaria TaxID=2527987 RepID=A0A5C5WZL5_9BACT|nr:hypothetical protein CA85_49380 [Allorhodopirellula solitaria]